MEVIFLHGESHSYHCLDNLLIKIRDKLSHNELLGICPYFYRFLMAFQHVKNCNFLHDCILTYDKNGKAVYSY